MANEKRLIDAKQAIAEMNRVETNRPYDDKEDILEKCVNLLYAAPTVDAVEVVRCKDCRSCKKHPTSDKVKMCTNENWNTEYYPLVHDNDFCSYGGRREGE